MATIPLQEIVLAGPRGFCGDRHPHLDRFSITFVGALDETGIVESRSLREKKPEHRQGKQPLQCLRPQEPQCVVLRFRFCRE